MKDLIFLPDREGGEELTQSCGFVRCGRDTSALADLSARLLLPEREAVRTDPSMWRGVLALALLCDAWPDADARITLRTVDSTTSLFAAWALSSRPEKERRDAVHLVLLEKGGRRVLLGTADAHAGLKLPAAPSDFADMVPARAAWYDAEADVWYDPTPYLNTNELALLLSRMTRMGLDAPEADAFREALTHAEDAAIQAVEAEDADALHALSLRLRAICGLKDFAAFTVQPEPVAAAENVLLRLYAPDGRDVPPARESCTYLWEGVPFARTSELLGLTDTVDPCQGEALSRVEAELALLAENSVRWNGDTARAVAAWTDERGELLPRARQAAEDVRRSLMDKGCQAQTSVTLTWPWDAASGAVRYLLQENLGLGWMRGAGAPFADRLTKLTGHVLGDTVLHHCCACADGVLLPPLSQAMAACVAAAREGEGLAVDALRFEPREDGGITASFLLRGMGEVRMVRVYAADEIAVIAEAEAPCVAVWPCVPMDSWRAYHVFTRAGGVEVAALSGGAWVSLPAEVTDETDEPQRRPWRCLHTETYPACLTILRDGLCLGALPNVLPLLRLEVKGEAVAAIDMGASSTAAALMVEGRAVPVQEQQLTRLLVTPQEMPEDDFLRSLTLKAVTPSAVALTGEGDTLFTDGYVYAVSRFDALQSMAPGTVQTALKWRADARSVRARRILLHQVMLGVSLNAMMHGVQSLRWRVTVADEMGDEGRNDLLEMVEALSAVVAEETGLPVTAGKSAVVWAEEAAALQAFLRNEGGQKGSFAVLDVGSGSTKMHLWLQGRSRPNAGAVLMEGSQSVLLHAFRENPEMLRQDFADCGNEALMAAVDVLCGQLMLARESLAQADKALLMLDALLDEFRQDVIRHLYERCSAQRPTFLQAILLEMLAASLFGVGLMLEQCGSDSMVSSLFPGDLPICLTGRGAWLLETLTPQMRNGLQYIAHAPMNLRHPVRTVTVRPAQLPAMGVALGMAQLRDTGMPIDPPAVRTRRSFSELMRMLLVQCWQQYPLHMWLLHPGLFDVWGSLTAEGEDVLRREASTAYGDGEDIPASVMDFMRRMRSVYSQNVAFPAAELQ